MSLRNEKNDQLLFHLYLYIRYEITCFKFYMPGLMEKKIRIEQIFLETTT